MLVDHLLFAIGDQHHHKAIEAGDDAAELKTIHKKQGLVEEIRDLLDSGIPANCTAMQAIGYKEFLSALDGQISMEEAADQVRKASRHYAKRQLTWFRRNGSIHWLRRGPGDTGEEILSKARQILHETDK